MEDIKRTSIQFRTSVHNCVPGETIGNYEQTRNRVTRFKNNKSMSDKEIIEFLAEEIEQYRDKINNLEQTIIDKDKTINELRNRTIQSEEVTLNTTEDELVDKDIVETISITQYADGKPVISKTEYKYKEN